ncbi:hypothetical protein [Ferribacterium limneticum]|uniref:hypothetical protein n=1 Tax=Ferribacterium limneticum TaxID=76259 RepID=UPI001CF8812E|nr:hypothetical protein [Ferribacterium limneticum]UCV21407.1 hypothetical protein KI613_12715 [Ferribacterium limneticum]
MSISKLISRMTAGKLEKHGETMSYDAIFKGATSSQDLAAANFLPGLRAVENEVDAYFKDVFAGSVF